MRIDVKNNPERILYKAQYRNGNRGYIKELSVDPQSDGAKAYIKNHYWIVQGKLIPRKVIKSHRFHALVTGNEIDLHFDHEKKGKHVTKKFGFKGTYDFIAAEINNLKAIDEMGVV